MFNPAAQLEQLTHQARTAASWAAVEGAALRGELGESAQRIALESWAERYQALRAAGQVEAARELKAQIKRICRVED